MALDFAPAHRPRLYPLVARPPVCTLGMVVLPALMDRPMQRRFAEKDHPAEALADLMERTAHPFLGRVGPLECDQAAVPLHQRIWGDHRGDLIQRPPPEDLRLRGESPTLVICQPQLPTLPLFQEDAVLLDKVRDDLGLVPVHNAGERQEEDLPRGGRGPHRVILPGRERSRSWAMCHDPAGGQGGPRRVDHRRSNGVARSLIAPRYTLVCTSVCCGRSSSVFSTLPGIPPTSEWGGTSRVTTAFAAITLS